MKICLINNLFKPYGRGGSEKVLEFLFDNLKLRGHEVSVITTRPYLGRSTDEVSGIYYLPSTFYKIARVNFLWRFCLHCWNLVDFVTLIKVKKILKQERPDLVLTHNLLGLSFLIPGLIAKMKIRHIHTVHDLQLMHPSGLVYHGRENILDSLAARVYQAICRKLFVQTITLLSPSNWLMEQYVERGFFAEASKFVLPNPSPAAQSQVVRAKNNDHEFTFLYVGQVEEHKGIIFLAKVFVNHFFSFWRRTGDNNLKLNVKLLIVGSGSQLRDLEKITYGDQKIQVLGGKTNEEVRALMKEVDCLIVPSLCYENSPMVIYEAINAGLPVIASRIGGITELLHRSGGILFQPGSAADLIKKMEYLLNNQNILRAITEKESSFEEQNYIDNLLSVL